MPKIGELPGSWRVRHDKIPPDLARTLHAKVQELALRDSSPVSVARRISASYSLSLSPGTVRHWMVGDRNPLQNTLFRNSFDLEPSPALSYIIGANLGDGCVLERNWCVKLQVTDLDFAREFNRSMTVLFSRGKPNSIIVQHFDANRLPMFVVKYSSKQLARLLLSPANKVLGLAFDFPREFLRGFFDAEGHVDVCAQSSFRIIVGAENSNKLLLNRINTVLASRLGIVGRIYTRRRAGSIKSIRGRPFQMRRTSYSLEITKLENVKKFEQKVGFSISRKEKKLKDALVIFRKFGTQARVDEWNKWYFKRRGEWVRREGRLSPKSKELNHEVRAPTRGPVV